MEFNNCILNRGKSLFLFLILPLDQITSEPLDFYAIYKIMIGF